jgi:NUDIX domain
MKKKLSEIVGDYSVSSTRRMQSPGNIRAGYPVKGYRSSIEKDEQDDQEKIDQDNLSLPQAAVVLVVNNVSRWSNYDDLNVPGGLIEDGEEPSVAAAREVFEETGIRVSGLVPIYKAVQGGHMVHAFKASSFSGDLKKSHEGIPSWEKPSTLLMGRFGNYFRKMIQSIPGDVISKKL